MRDGSVEPWPRYARLVLTVSWWCLACRECKQTANSISRGRINAYRITNIPEGS